MEIINMPKNAEFYCETCDFRCIKKSNYIIHTKTKKHIHRVSGNDLENAELEYQTAIFNQRRAAIDLMRATQNLNIENI